MENLVYNEIIAHLQHCRPGRPLITTDDEEYEIRASIVKWLLMPSSESCVQFTETQEQHLIRELAATWSEVYFKLVLQALIEEDGRDEKGCPYLHPIMFRALQAQGELYMMSTGFMMLDQWSHSDIMSLLTSSKCRNMEFFLKTDLPLVLFRGVIYEYESRNHAYRDALAMQLVNSFIAVANMVTVTTFRVPHEFLLKIMEVLRPLRRMKLKSEEAATRVLEATDIAFCQVKEATHSSYFFSVLTWVDLHKAAGTAVTTAVPEVPDRVWRYLKGALPYVLDVDGMEEQVLLKKYREHLMGDFYLATECNMNLNMTLKALWRRISCAMKGCGQDDVTELLIEAIRLRQMRVMSTWGPSTKYLLAALLEANTRELTEQESREVGAILVKDKELLECLMESLGRCSRKTLTLEKANSCFEALEKASCPDDCLLAKYRREEVFEYLDESYDAPQIERLRNLDPVFWALYQEWCDKKHEAWEPPLEDTETESDSDDSTAEKVRLFREQVCTKRKATKSKHLNKRQRV